MDILNNLGIGYTGDYLVQGSQIDKCKKSSQLDIKYTEFCVKIDGKENYYNQISNYYFGKTIFHLPTINFNQSNLKRIKETVNEIILNDVDLFVIDASTLLYETYDWSTDEEQRNYLKNMAKGIATIVSFNKEVAIENTSFDNNSLLFGKSISNISDLLVYTRNVLVEDFDFSRDKANKMVGISLNINNLIKNNDIDDLEDWIKVFSNDIKCFKISNVEANIQVISKLIDLIKEYNIDKPIILETKEEIVVYRRLYEDTGLWIRPVNMFLSEVDHNKYPDVKQKYRFTRMEMNADGTWHCVEEEDNTVILEVQSDSKNVAKQQETGIQAENPDEERPDPKLMEYLDAETFDEKYNVLVSMRDCITDKLVDDIAVVMDVVIPEGDLMNRYDALKMALRTKQKYESANRLR